MAGCAKTDRIGPGVECAAHEPQHHGGRHVAFKGAAEHSADAGLDATADAALRAADACAKALGLRLLPLADPWAIRQFVLGLRSRESLSAKARLLVDFLHERAASTRAARGAHQSADRLLAGD